MGIRVLQKDAGSFRENLRGKRRIMTYGGGIWADDIRRMLKGFGYELSCAIVDRQYYDGSAYVERHGG